MNFMLAATIASSLLIFVKSTNSDKRRGHQRSTKDKNLNPSKMLNSNQNSVKPKKITVRKSSDPWKPSDHSHKSSFHFVVETFENDKDRSKKKGKARSGDYQANNQNNPWLDKCSLKSTGEAKQLDVPGCGGRVHLNCPGGCLSIHKVKKIQHHLGSKRLGPKRTCANKLYLLSSLGAHV